MSKVTYAESARIELKKIYDYIAVEKQNKEAANGLDDAIRKKCQIYAQYPYIGRVSENYGAGVRRFPHGNYVIFYKPTEDGIIVLHVWHGAQNLPDLIRPHGHE